ncbi:hypothetical protein RvY_00828-2 [Ramazzottius varieornatus]|uniref:Uncharacterized protein n=1 Tax=Ramazzottius varieornatus TaxID=947166 RepID=A0A1D1UNX6_RAMVA|nr:hypothetical protein RvY_00828-2 [Ramazzottius varieornatus]
MGQLSVSTSVIPVAPVVDIEPSTSSVVPDVPVTTPKLATARYNALNYGWDRHEDWHTITLHWLRNEGLAYCCGAQLTPLTSPNRAVQTLTCSAVTLKLCCAPGALKKYKCDTSMRAQRYHTLTSFVYYGSGKGSWRKSRPRSHSKPLRCAVFFQCSKLAICRQTCRITCD